VLFDASQSPSSLEPNPPITDLGKCVTGEAGNREIGSSGDRLIE